MSLYTDIKTLIDEPGVSVFWSDQNVFDASNEALLEMWASTKWATATATLTAAQVTGGVLVGDPSTSAASYTLPTASAIDAVMTNMKVGSTFDLTVINLGTSSSVTAAVTDYPVPGGAIEVITVTNPQKDPITHVATITASGTPTLYFTLGWGI